MIVFVRELISGSVDKCLLRPLSWTWRRVSIARGGETYEAADSEQTGTLDLSEITAHTML
jgi:hypothetical protein